MFSLKFLAKNKGNKNQEAKEKSQKNQTHWWNRMNHHFYEDRDGAAQDGGG